MSRSDWKRREFVKVLMSLPLGYVTACAVEAKPVAQDSLAKLVLALGPWPEAERERAEEFTRRFLAAERLVGFYLPDSAEVIQRVAGRLPDDAMSLSRIDLATLTTQEREFVIQLVQQLYSLIEMRFDIANEPRWGVCLGERTRYTRAPA
jgi:hypothetical protein